MNKPLRIRNTAVHGVQIANLDTETGESEFTAEPEYAEHTGSPDSEKWTLILPAGAYLESGPTEIKLVLKDGSVPATFTKLHNAQIFQSSDWELKYRTPKSTFRQP